MKLNPSTTHWPGWLRRILLLVGGLALLVVRPPDSRFSRRLMERYFSREGITVNLAYSSNDYAELTDGWWRTHWKAQQMVEAAASTVPDSLCPECR
ncbi:MAG TPA: hypothetical protein VNQ79_10495 [Blastocatellia bacterium]|nr:hypothetical protein [Blastocatellia bacterium]